MKLNLAPFRSRAAVMTAIGLTLIGGATVAQTVPMEPIQWDKRRLDQLDRNVRRIERALTQRNAAGQPVIVEPDPEVIALMGRVDIMDRRLQDLEATVRRVNGDLERMTFALDEAERDNNALRTRVTDADNRIEALETTAREAEEARRAAEEAEASRSPTGSAAGDLAAARTLAGTDPARGAEAYQAILDAWPEAIEAREATWRLGDLRRSAGDMARAVQLYATALSGWPTASWAPEVTLKLAGGLEATDRNTQACAALGEFNRRYSSVASQQLKTIASQIRGRAGCS